MAYVGLGFCLNAILTTGCALNFGEMPPEFSLPNNARNIGITEPMFGAGSISTASFDVTGVAISSEVLSHYESLTESRGWHRVTIEREPWVNWSWTLMDTEGDGSDCQKCEYRAHWVDNDEEWSLRVALTTDCRAVSDPENPQAVLVEVATSRFVLLNEDGSPIG